MRDRVCTRRDFVSASALAVVTWFGGTLLTGCARNTPLPRSVGSSPPAPQPLPQPSTGPTGPVVPQPPDVLSKYEMPHYPGSVQRGEFKFKWPRIDYYLKASHDWGYYTSNDAPAKVMAFFRKQSKKGPYKKRDVWDFHRRSEGYLSYFFDGSLEAWILVWAIPQPGDSLKTNIAVMGTRNLGSALIFD